MTKVFVIAMSEAKKQSRCWQIRSPRRNLKVIMTLAASRDDTLLVMALQNGIQRERKRRVLNKRAAFFLVLARLPDFQIQESPEGFFITFGTCFR
jgi:hypothetical protein